MEHFRLCAPLPPRLVAPLAGAPVRVPPDLAWSLLRACSLPCWLGRVMLGMPSNSPFPPTLAAKQTLSRGQRLLNPHPSI